MKFDVFVCTKNSEKLLPLVLPQIEKVVCGSINRRFVVDDFSSDNTKEVAESLGWKVYSNHKQGLVYAQRYALSLVKTDFYASFEHDIFLSSKWFPTIPNLVVSGKYDIAQGIRVRNVEGFKQADIYDYSHRQTIIPSQDNTFYLKSKTLSCTLNRYYIDNTVCSVHLRKSIIACLKHDLYINLFFGKPFILSLTKHLIYSPFQSLRIFKQTKSKHVLFCYPLERLFILAGATIRAINAKVKHQTIAINGEILK